jgi:hypothetical protein
MPTLDDVNIALVQRGDLPHSVVIPRTGGLGGTASGRGRGGGPVGGRGGISAGGRGGGPVHGGPASGQGSGPADGRGGDPAGGFDPALAPSKGKDKQVWVVLDDDEVSSDEDAPLQKRLRLSSTTAGSSGSAPTMVDVAAATKAVADKEATYKRAPGSAAGGMTQTPEGVLEDLLEESEEELEMAPEPVPEVVLEEVPVEGAMIVTHVATPSPPHGAAVASLLEPHVATAAGDAPDAMVGPEVILGHPTSYAPDDIPLEEAVSTAHGALSQVQCVLRREDEGLVDERWCLHLWDTMLKEMKVSERVVARAW